MQKYPVYRRDGLCTQANAKGYEQEIILSCVFLNSEREMIFYST